MRNKKKEVWQQKSNDNYNLIQNDELTKVVANSVSNQLDLTHWHLTMGNLYHLENLLSANKTIYKIYLTIIQKEEKNFFKFIENLMCDKENLLQEIYLNANNKVVLSKEQFQEIFEALLANELIKHIEFNNIDFTQISLSRMLEVFAKLTNKVTLQLNKSGLSDKKLETIMKFQGTSIHAKYDASYAQSLNEILEEADAEAEVSWEIVEKPLNPKVDPFIPKLSGYMNCNTNSAQQALDNNIKQEIIEENNSTAEMITVEKAAEENASAAEIDAIISSDKSPILCGKNSYSRTLKVFSDLRKSDVEPVNMNSSRVTKCYKLFPKNAAPLIPLTLSEVSSEKVDNTTGTANPYLSKLKNQ